jgi:hypothetical protein
MGSETVGPRACIDAGGWAGGLYEASGSSSTSVTGGSGVVWSDGLERWMGDDIFFLNKDIIADKPASASTIGDKRIGLPGMMKAREIARARLEMLIQ